VILYFDYLAGITVSEGIKHLRIGVSFFLMPTFLFALSQCTAVNATSALLCFVVLHFLLYPASHAYNNYHDNDTGAISGIEKPLPKNKSLLVLSSVLDLTGLIICGYLNVGAGIIVLIYIAGSRAYSNRSIRLKQYPVISYICVSGTQGLLVYFITIFCCSKIEISFLQHIGPALLSSLFIGSAYPITQIYQHETDKQDGITTLSSKLGIKGTFQFCIAMYGFTHVCTLGYLYATMQHNQMFVYVLLNAIPTYFFTAWYKKAMINESEVNYKNTMKVAAIGSVCSNIAFAIFAYLNQG
jgi:1,4-dihydroxy-2-naphthoate polyprenyltransferase